MSDYEDEEPDVPNPFGDPKALLKGMNPDDVQEEAVRLAAGRDPNPFDYEIFLTVAGLTMRLRECRELLAQFGPLTTDGQENPLLEVERKTSQELRGWVKARPDLFDRVEAVEAIPQFEL